MIPDWFCVQRIPVKCYLKQPSVMLTSSSRRSTNLRSWPLQEYTTLGRSMGRTFSILRSTSTCKSTSQVSSICSSHHQSVQSAKLCLCSAFCKLRHLTLSMRSSRSISIHSFYSANPDLSSKISVTIQRKKISMGHTVCRSVGLWRPTTSSLMLSGELLI